MAEHIAYFHAYQLTCKPKWARQFIEGAKSQEFHKEYMRFIESAKAYKNGKLNRLA